jgi:hypothetical protein
MIVHKSIRFNIDGLNCGCYLEHVGEHVRNVIKNLWNILGTSLKTTLGAQHEHGGNAK